MFLNNCDKIIKGLTVNCNAHYKNEINRDLHIFFCEKKGNCIFFNVPIFLHNYQLDVYFIRCILNCQKEQNFTTFSKVLFT
jgi:hypothetical protein